MVNEHNRRSGLSTCPEKVNTSVPFSFYRQKKKPVPSFCITKTQQRCAKKYNQVRQGCRLNSLKQVSLQPSGRRLLHQLIRWSHNGSTWSQSESESEKSSEKKRSDVRTKHPRGHVSAALCRRIDGSAVKVLNPLNIVLKLTVSVIGTHNIQPYLLHQSAPILKCHVINLLWPIRTESGRLWDMLMSHPR